VSSRLIVTPGIGVVLIGLVSLIQPFGAVKAHRGSKPLLKGSQVDAAVVRLMERSCGSCHSERTEWPLYSYIAPISWLMEHDVEEARSHMNLSQWEEYSADDQTRLLTRIAAAVRSREMPLARYTRLHPEARLSDQEVDLIYLWARAERTRVKGLHLSPDVR
jgi:hypothetical protein